MVIFHSYVKLPEGILIFTQTPHHRKLFFAFATVQLADLSNPLEDMYLLHRTQDSSRGFGNWYRSYSADRSMESSIKLRLLGHGISEPASNWVRTSYTPNYKLYIVIYYICTWFHIYNYIYTLNDYHVCVYIYIDSLTSCSTQLPGPSKYFLHS